MAQEPKVGVSVVTKVTAAICLAGALALAAFMAVAPPTAREQASEPPVLGGPFTLVSHLGEEVRAEDFAGRLMLVYFGYSFCPDFCPTTLQTMSAALDELGADANDVAFLFVSVDPARDTVEHLANYVDLFDERLIGLTGTTEQIDEAVANYRVYYKIHDDQGEGYPVDHSTFAYLMGRDGYYEAHFSHDTQAEAMAERIRQAL